MNRHAATASWLAVVLLVLAACAPEAPAPEAMAAAEPGALAERPDPRLRIDTPAGVVPARVLVDLGVAVFDPEQIGQAPGDTTLWSLQPEVGATLLVDSPTTLALIPEESFDLGTTYTLRLEALESGGETLQPADGEAWSLEFTTPPLRLVQLVPIEVDPRRSRVTVDLVFSAPVDPASVSAHSSFELESADGRRRSLRRLRWLTNSPDTAIRVTISDIARAKQQTLHLELAAGVRQADGPAVLEAVSSDLALRKEPLVTIRDVRPAESGAGFAVEIVCHDESVAERRYYWDRLTRRSYGQLSRRCRPEPDTVAGLVRIEPAVAVAVSPSGGGFRLTGDFKRGTYKLVLEGGLETIDGGVLP
ncbi:MAG: hypothetical protein PVG92_02470, partial [Holophagae bacterium]